MERLEFSYRGVRGGLAALSLLFLASSAHARDDPRSDLELYRSSSLAGLHEHPIGFEGHQLDVAERKFSHRRAIIRAWLVGREGAAALDAVDEDIAEVVHGVYWVRSPSVAQEWHSIRRAKQDLSVLERRKRLAGEASNGH